MPMIYVDADACPVKNEVCKVAARYELEVVFVANSRMRVPDGDAVRLEVVGGALDAADDWIVDRVDGESIVVTADIPLASRCLNSGAWVLGPTGKAFTEANIGPALATRDLLSDLRGAGVVTGGPNAFEKKDRSRFLQALDEMVVAVQKLRI